jgi:hypothetical protein
LLGLVVDEPEVLVGVLVALDDVLVGVFVGFGVGVDVDLPVGRAPPGPVAKRGDASVRDCPSSAKTRPGTRLMAESRKSTANATRAQVDTGLRR